MKAALWIVGGVAVGIIGAVQTLQKPVVAASDVEYDTVRSLAEPPLDHALARDGVGFAEGTAGCWVASPRATCTMLAHSSMFQSEAFATLEKSGDTWMVTGTHVCRNARCQASEFGNALHSN